MTFGDAGRGGHDGETEDGAANDARPRQRFGQRPAKRLANGSGTARDDPPPSHHEHPRVAPTTDDAS